MKRLNIVLKLSILVSYASCVNLPSKVIRFDSDVSYTCCEIQSISHNLQLDDEVTDHLNRICWTKNRREYVYKFYLVAVFAESPNQGTTVDVPFTSSDCQAFYFNDGEFEFKVFNKPSGTWRIVCTFPETNVSDAQRLFSILYRDHARRFASLKSFEVKQIRKYPNHDTADFPYSSRTFIYHERGREGGAFFLTTSQESVTLPVIIFSKGDFEVTDVSIAFVTVSLLLRDDDYPYVLHFNDVTVALGFAKYMWPYNRRAQ